jgi:hypothetical protein
MKGGGARPEEKALEVLHALSPGADRAVRSFQKPTHRVPSTRMTDIC